MANCKKDNYRRFQLCTTLLKLDKHTNPANHLALEPQATLNNLAEFHNLYNQAQEFCNIWG